MMLDFSTQLQAMCVQRFPYNAVVAMVSDVLYVTRSTALVVFDSGAEFYSTCCFQI